MAVKKKTKKTKKSACYFCTSESVPDYKDTLILRRFINDRGKLIPASRSGVCSKCQRKLAVAVKRARFMSLIPYADKHAL